MSDHECVFVEEEEPSGRLVLPPCIVCGITAMDAIAEVERERDQARDYGERMYTEKRLAERTL